MQEQITLEGGTETMKGKELREFRKQKNLNQIEFAKFFGVTQAAVSQYENGERTIPNEVAKVVKAFPPIDKERAALSYYSKFENVDHTSQRDKILIMNAFVAGVDWQQNFRKVSAIDGCSGNEAPEWIVNDIGELGVHVGGRDYFLYKGRSLSYEDDNKCRQVGKREFGETCISPLYDKPQFKDNEIPWRDCR